MAMRLSKLVLQRPRWRFILGTCALLALGLITRATLADDRDNLAGAELMTDRTTIEKLLSDRTLYGRYSDGDAWAEYHEPDGRTAYHQNNCTHAGRWWIESGLVCFRYDDFNAGRPTCFQLYRRGDRLEFYNRQFDGSWKLNAYTTDIRPDNPDKMPVEGQACVGV
jgi:hypothetical protein